MLTKKQINFLNRVCPNIWAEENNMVNIHGHVCLYNINLVQIPVQFGQVIGWFCCENCNLTTLKGGPKEIRNSIYSCLSNMLPNLIGAPETCNNSFWCNLNKLTSLEGCPKLIRGDLLCQNNPNLYILYGIGKVRGEVVYDNHNDLNEWIIKRTRKNIFVSYYDIAKWIKRNNKLKYLLKAQKEIRQHFSPKILHLIDTSII